MSKFSVKNVHVSTRGDLNGTFARGDNVLLASINSNVNQANSEAIKNMTKLVIFSSFLNVIGFTPYAAVYILDQTIFTPVQIFVYYSISNLLLNVSPIFDICIYYFFNKLYRDVFKSYLKKILVKSLSKITRNINVKLITDISIISLCFCFV